MRQQTSGRGKRLQGTEGKKPEQSGVPEIPRKRNRRFFNEKKTP